MVPTFGTTDQVTFELVVPVTVAVNCWVCPAVMEDEAGETVTVIPPAAGERVTVAIPTPAPFAALVAVTVTVVVLGIEAGAV
jgi:hypothetical protein